MVHSTTAQRLSVNGVVNKQLVHTALEHATVHVSSTEVIEDATVVFYQGRIEAVGLSSVMKVNGPVIRYDLNGLHVYPSFVDIHSNYAMPEAQREGWGRGPQDLSDKKGAFGWNEAIRPETHAADVFDPSDAEADRSAYQKGGFGAVVSHVQDGIVRGTGALVALSEDPRRALLKPPGTLQPGRGLVPGLSLFPMGATALLFRCKLVRGCQPLERAIGEIYRWRPSMPAVPNLRF